jgi:hypothetical protein
VSHREVTRALESLGRLSYASFWEKSQCDWDKWVGGRERGLTNDRDQSAFTAVNVRGISTVALKT